MLSSPVRRTTTAPATRLRAGVTCAALLAVTACAGIAAAGPASADTAPAAPAVTQSARAAASVAPGSSAPGSSAPESSAPVSPAPEVAPVVAPEPSTPTAPEVAPDPKPAAQPTDVAVVDAPEASDASAPPVVAPRAAAKPQASVRTTPRSAAVVTMVATAPVVTTQPMETWVDIGQSATFTAHASGSPTPTVQWQSRRWFEDPWTDIPGATSDSYQSPPAALTDAEPAFRAVFTNSAGSVATSAAELRRNDPPPAPGTPSEPRNVKARQTAPGQITITWEASASAGTSPIIGYGAGYGTRRWGNGDSFSPTTFKAVFDDIDDGDYTAVVFAMNDSGISRRVVVPISVGDLPSAPRHLAATRSGSKVTVTWAAPASAGYSAVGGYDIVLTSSTGRVSRTVPAGVTSAVFTDLPAGTYRIVVAASNTVGAGAAAHLTVTVPAATPQAPIPAPRPPASAVPASSAVPAAAPAPAAAALPAPAAQLAHTGVSGSAQTGLALGLLALGLAFSFGARRLRGGRSAA